LNKLKQHQRKQRDIASLMLKLQAAFELSKCNYQCAATRHTYIHTTWRCCLWMLLDYQVL